MRVSAFVASGGAALGETETLLRQDYFMFITKPLSPLPDERMEEGRDECGSPYFILLITSMECTRRPLSFLTEQLRARRHYIGVMYQTG